MRTTGQGCTNKLQLFSDIHCVVRVAKVGPLRRFRSRGSCGIFRWGPEIPTRLAFSFADETRADVVRVWYNLHFLNLELVRIRPISLIPGGIWTRWEKSILVDTTRRKDINTV